MKKQIISFTGHRDRICSIGELNDLKKYAGDCIWRHGGARGFDSFVSKYCKDNNIEEVVIRPEYDKYGRAAPIIRNRTIIEGSILLVACYDGREYGGTFYTVNLAKKLDIPTIVVSAKPFTR